MAQFAIFWEMAVVAITLLHVALWSGKVFFSFRQLKILAGSDYFLLVVLLIALEASQGNVWFLLPFAIAAVYSYILLRKRLHRFLSAAHLGTFMPTSVEECRYSGGERYYKYYGVLEIENRKMEAVCRCALMHLVCGDRYAVSSAGIIDEDIDVLLK